MTESPEASVATISGFISRDPSLTAELL